MSLGSRNICLRCWFAAELKPGTLCSFKTPALPHVNKTLCLHTACASLISRSDRAALQPFHSPSPKLHPTATPAVQSATIVHYPFLKYYFQSQSNFGALHHMPMKTRIIFVQAARTFPLAPVTTISKHLNTKLQEPWLRATSCSLLVCGHPNAARFVPSMQSVVRSLRTWCHHKFARRQCHSMWCNPKQQLFSGPYQTRVLCRVEATLVHIVFTQAALCLVLNLQLQHLSI